MEPLWPVTGSGLGSTATSAGWLSSVRLLFNDAVAVAGDPDVVLVVDEAAMEAGRHSPGCPVAGWASVAADRVARRGPERRGSGGHVGRPGVHHVPRAIVFDDRGRGMRHHGLRRDQVVLGPAVDREEMVLRVDASPGDFPGHPGLAGSRPGGAKTGRHRVLLAVDGQRFWPERIDLVERGFVLALRDGLLQRAPQPEPDDQCGHDGTEIHEAPFLHGDLLVEREFVWPLEFRSRGNAPAIEASSPSASAEMRLVRKSKLA